jgi:hypothetical protein
MDHVLIRDYSDVARNGIVTVEINHGDTTEAYCVHKDLLMRSSERFATTLKPLSKGSSGRFTLVDVEPATFNLFLNWLYTDSPYAFTREWHRNLEWLGNPFETSDHTVAKIQTFTLQLLKLLVFADRYSIPTLRRITSQHIIDIIHKPRRLLHTVDSRFIAYAFGELPAEDSILKLLVDKWCLDHATTADLEVHLKALEACPPAFIVRCLRGIILLHERPTKAVAPLCEYHGHQSVAERETCETIGDVVKKVVDVAKLECVGIDAGVDLSKAVTFLQSAAFLQTIDQSLFDDSTGTISGMAT